MPRRRVLRPTPPIARADARQLARMQRRRAELAKSRVALRRWFTRLKRATHTVTDLYQRITKLEAMLTQNS